MIKPLKFKPVRIGTIWGGEDWILSAMEGRETVCLTGGDTGLDLSALVAKYGERLVGKRVWKKFGGRFPLLVKYINSRDQLSVQVHPDDVMAERLGEFNGKTEMWHVIQADDGARINVGFNRRLNRNELQRILEEANP